MQSPAIPNGPDATAPTVGVIYVVDDEPMLLELAAILLEPLGRRVETFSDPRLALAAFREAQPPPDLLITDHSMPHLTGVQLGGACRAHRPGQKVLMLTGTVGEQTLQRTGFVPDAILAKPYQHHELINAASALLAGTAQR